MQDTTLAPKGTYIATINPVEPSRWDAYRPANFKSNISLSSRYSAASNVFPSFFNGKGAKSQLLHPRKAGKNPYALTIEEMSRRTTVSEPLAAFCIPCEQVLTGKSRTVDK